MPKAKTGVATALDLGNHEGEDWTKAHGIWEHMRLAVLELAWPIGSIFLSVVATSPATLLGIGTWSQIAGGKFLVGQTSGDTAFDTPEETGGSKTKNLSHTHPVNPPDTQSTVESATEAVQSGTGNGVAANNHKHNINIAEFDSGAGGGASQDILPPYLVVYIWKRTA
jgi:hypothetical protein